MADLVARSALDGLGLPLGVGAATLAAGSEAPLVEVLALGGAGLDLPGPGASGAGPEGTLAIWAGLDRWLLRGAPVEAVAARLGDAVAVVDQSDGWAALVLSGPTARDVLARLTPLDLDPSVFPPGAVACSALRHVPCILLAAEGGFELLVPRSYAGSAVADLSEAMRLVAARAEL